jgi:hypothetical protein
MVPAAGCKADGNSQKDVNTSAEDYPIHEKIVGTWVKPNSVDGFVLNADGTGKDYILGSFTYKLEYRKSELDSSGSSSATFSVTGWVLSISYDAIPAGKTMWAILSKDAKSLTTRDSSGNTVTYTRK